MQYNIKAQVKRTQLQSHYNATNLPENWIHFPPLVVAFNNDLAHHCRGRSDETEFRLTHRRVALSWKPPAIRALLSVRSKHSWQRGSMWMATAQGFLPSLALTIIGILIIACSRSQSRQTILPAEVEKHITVLIIRRTKFENIELWKDSAKAPPSTERWKRWTDVYSLSFKNTMLYFGALTQLSLAYHSIAVY